MPAMRLFHSNVPVTLALATTLVGSTVANALPDAAATTETLYCDQIIAELPREQAPLASVALARLTIVLHDAKRRAALTLCHGNWPPSGEPLQQLGPLAIEKAPTDSVWLYHAVRRARPLNCGNVSREQFFLEMSRHLPAWISLRPAGQTSTFRQGGTAPPPDTGVASR